MRKVFAGLGISILLLVGGANIAGALNGGSGPSDSPTNKKEVNPPACRDGRDNDKDGLVDYPADPGCKSQDDPTEQSDVLVN
jgi:hypothetical protein